MSGLTVEQQAVVTHPAGRPARVLAGAGTGKTRVIVARFAHLVESGVKPDRILALTFSRGAAAQMRTEVVRHLRASATLWISTFHSFCLRVLEAEQAAPARLVQEAEARAILAGLAPGMTGRRLEEAHAFIGQAKDQLLTPAEVAAYAQAQGDDRLRELADLYGRFQAELQRLEAAEFGDFITLVVQRLESDPAAAARWQERFEHILVDEFQDTNLAQFRVLQLLARPHGNLMVVGDDDQAIYRFRGATDRYMRRFPEFVQGSVDYPVVENFRCPQPVLDVANRLIERNAPERVAKQLKTTTKVHGFPPVAHWEAATQRDEAEAVAAEIARRVKAGERKAGDFAILVRSVRRSGGEFARALRERGIPCRLVGEAYPHPVVTQTLALLRLTQGLTAPDLLTVLAGRVAPADLFVAVRGASGDLAGYLAAAHGPAATAYAEICSWINRHKHSPVDEIVYEALRFLGYLAVGVQPSAADLDRLAAVRFLQEAAAGAATLGDLLAVAGGTSAGECAPGGSADSVAIMTIHAAKGLQFPVVFVATLAEGIFPVAVDAAPVYYLAEAARDWADTGALRSLTATQRLAQHIREERRLAYVALTRAEEELILTRALSYGGEPALPSRFLTEMGAPDPVTVSGRSGDLASAARAYLLGVAAGTVRPDSDRVAQAAAAIQADPSALPLREQAPPAPFAGGDTLTLSASAIETYRQCPRQYYYGYILRLPDEDTLYTAFGTALHAALERFNKERQAGNFPSWTEVEAYWHAAIQPEPFESLAQFRQLKERGRIFLKRYYDWVAVAPRAVVETEGWFEFPYVDRQGRTHMIRGRYDLIERDEEGHEIILDYKSGKRSNVVNKTLRGGGDKHPQRKLQLGLYYLARYGGRVKPGAKVSYIFLRHENDQPPRGWIEAFDPSEQAIACDHTAETLTGIRSIIDDVIDGILANNFAPNVDDWTCGQCLYRDACEVSRRAYF